MAPKKRGLFITLEGLDGSGKSTQFKLLAARLRKEGFPVTLTREPGGHPLAEKIRTLLLSTHETPPVAEAELLLFLAARAQHVSEIILPALQAGNIVLCERFSDSTFAYQAGGRRLSPAFVQQANQFAAFGLEPDLTLWYDLPVSIGLTRAFQAKQGHDRMEAGSKAFMDRVRKGYMHIAKQHPGRIKRIRADQAVEQVAEESWEHVRRAIRPVAGRRHAV